MKIGILSDIHDQKANLEIVISQLREKSVKELIVLGDFCAPPTVRQLVASGLRCRCIYGNNDGDRARMLKAAQGSSGRVTFGDDEYDVYELQGKKVFVTHYPQIAKDVAISGKYDAVFYGHDHRHYQEKLENGTLLLNPGEVWGWLHGSVSYAIWDSEVNDAEIVVV